MTRKERTDTSQGQASDFHAEDILDKPFDRALAGRLLRYVTPYWGRIVVSLLLIVGSTVLSLVTPILFKEAIDGPLQPENQASTPLLDWLRSALGAEDLSAERLSWLHAIAGVYLFVLVGGFVLRFWQWVHMNETGQRVMRDLRMDVFRHLQTQSLRFFQRQPVGRLVTRVTSDVEALNELLSSGFVTFVGDILSLLGVVVLLFYYNAPLALLSLSVLPPLLGVTALFRSRARRHYRENRRRIAHLNAFTQESIGGMDVIQISRREDAQAERYRQINQGYLDSWLGSVFWFSIFYPAVEILSAVSLALVVVYGGLQIESGFATFGEFFLFWTCLNKFFVPIRELAEKYNVLQAAMASAERIFGLLDTETRLPRSATPQPVRPLEGSIRFENVSFAYDQEKPVLRDVTFEVARGETVALVGATGAGKSTVANLLMRFYDPSVGRIMIDGVDLRDLDVVAHRRRFGLVLQDVSIFSRTVRDNLDLDRDLPLDRLVEAARQVGAHDFVERLEKGYEEVMKERGRTLSSGERQLLSFARALAGDPELLVLDEATSHVDSTTEAAIQQALDRLVTGRTSVIIAHRLSTIRSADRILVFHHGELREEGRHEDLLARQGIYARLHRLQFHSG